MYKLVYHCNLHKPLNTILMNFVVKSYGILLIRQMEEVLILILGQSVLTVFNDIMKSVDTSNSMFFKIPLSTSHHLNKYQISLYFILKNIFIILNIIYYIYIIL